MIRCAYIHEFDLYDDVMNEIQMNESYVDNLIRDYNMKREEIKMFNMMESVDDYFTEGVVEIIEKIGRGVERVISEIFKMIDKVVDSFRRMIWSHKSDAQKIEMILKKHPQMADELKLAFSKGELDVKDIKSMHDVLDGTYDIIGEMKKGKIEPSAAEMKFNKLITKWEKYGKPVVEIAAGVTTVLTAVKAVKNFYPDLLKNKLDGERVKSQLKELKLQAKIDNKNVKPEDMTIAQTASRMINTVCTKLTSNLRGINKLHNKFDTWMNNSLKKAKADNDRYDAVMNRSKDARETKKSETMAKFNDSLRQASQKTREEDLKDAEERAYRAELGKQKAHPTPTHHEEMKNIRDKAYHQEIGKRKAEEHLRDKNKELDDARARAFASEKGRRAAADEYMMKDRSLDARSHERDIKSNDAYDSEYAKLTAKADYEKNNPKKDNKN